MYPNLCTEHIFSLCGEINVLRALFAQVFKGIVNAEAKCTCSVMWLILRNAGEALGNYLGLGFKSIF